MAIDAKGESFAKLRTINKGVPEEMVEELILWLLKIGDMSLGFKDALDKGYFYQITPSPNAPNGGVQVWCNQDGGLLCGPGRTPNHELWRKGDGTFTVENNLSYG